MIGGTSTVVTAASQLRTQPIAAASDSGVAVAPLRVRSVGRQQVPVRALTVEVVGDQVGGNPSSVLASAAVVVCRCLGVCWAVTSFDRSGRLSAITTTPVPSPPAAAALARILTRRRAV